MAHPKLHSILLIATLLLTSCKPNEAMSSGNDSAPGKGLNAPMAQASCNGPIDFFMPQGSGFPGATWNDPSIVKTNDGYSLYASADHNFDGDIAIYRWVSKDAKNWELNPTEPVFSKNKNSNAWDGMSVETPAVVQFNNRYYLFYLGYRKRDVAQYRVGIATSADGINWVRAQDTPLISPTHQDKDFNQFITSEPSAIVKDGKIYLYFTAVGIDMNLRNTAQTIGLITSPDGKNWSKPQQILSVDQSVYPRSNDWYGLSTPDAVMSDGKVHVFASLTTDNPWRMVGISHAVSDNGINGWKQDKTPLLTRQSASWTTREIRSPSALWLGENRWRIFFGGDNHPNQNQFGIASVDCNID